MRKPNSVDALTELGRVRLSKSFFMRDMLHSEIAQVHGLLNAPDDPDLAIEVGTRLCEGLLEPLQERWGVMRIRSAYRSREVNAMGNAMQREGKAGYNCATNEANAAAHIWDMLDKDGCKGAMACVVLPAFYDDPAPARTLLRFACCKRPEVIAQASTRLATLPQTT